MTEEFTITIASDPEHEKVFAEVHCDGKFVALVSQENGLDRLRVEFPGSDVDESMIERAVDMEGFKLALISAARRLVEQKP
ncbi:MAG TPA: hypothetical protein VGL42_03770 [Opitutaceae bacterium]|jgi:hypothetical protein